MESRTTTLPDSSTLSSFPPPVRSLRDIIQYFSPAWFSVNMSTGIISTLLNGYPYGQGNRIVNTFALALFLLNVVLFIVFLGFSICRYIMFPRSWKLLLRHPMQSLYLGCFPMGSITLINVALNLVHQHWLFGGKTFFYILWALWWLGVVITFLCCFGLVYAMIVYQQHSMSTFTPAWVLPVTTLIVASSTGQLFVTIMVDYSVRSASITMAFAVAMVVVGVSICLMILTLYIRRLYTEGFPDASAIISSFLPLGPCGQAGYSILLAGNNLELLLPRGNGIFRDEMFSRILHALCFPVGFVLWCLAIWWLVLALMAVIHTVANGQRLKFQVQTWGLIFPNGVAALLTIELSEEMDSDIFRIMGAIYAATVILLWLLLACLTLWGVYDKSLFSSPYALPYAVQDTSPEEKADNAK